MNAPPFVPPTHNDHNTPDALFILFKAFLLMNTCFIPKQKYLDAGAESVRN
jgi:hypothetical protein